MKGLSSPLFDLKVKVGSVSRDTTLSGGTQAITGVGFKPKTVILLVAQNDSREMSIGLDDGISHISLSDSIDIANTYDTNLGVYSVVDEQTTLDYYRGYVSSFDTDGFTITWSPLGSPSGIIWVLYLAIR